MGCFPVPVLAAIGVRFDLNAHLPQFVNSGRQTVNTKVNDRFTV
jgi:hypothetical protein